MKHPHSAPSVTSLPASPQVESDLRVRKYMITMVIRTGCFLLMALVQPYGWWTAAFAVGAIFLPYIAVVNANAGADSVETEVESPLQQLESSASDHPVPEQPTVITVHERESRSAALPAGDEPRRASDR